MCFNDKHPHETLNVSPEWGQAHPCWLIVDEVHSLRRLPALYETETAREDGEMATVRGAGYFQYHAIPDNQARLEAFRQEVLRMCGWTSFGGAVSVVVGTGNASWSVWAICFLRFVSSAHILLYASTPNIQGKNRVREQRSHGSLVREERGQVE